MLQRACIPVASGFRGQIAAPQWSYWDLLRRVFRTPTVFAVSRNYHSSLDGLWRRKDWPRNCKSPLQYILGARFLQHSASEVLNATPSPEPSKYWGPPRPHNRTCVYCQKTFAAIANLVKHNAEAICVNHPEHIPRARLRSSSKRLRRKEGKVTEEGLAQRYECQHCSKSFVSREGLSYHEVFAVCRQNPNYKASDLGVNRTCKFCKHQFSQPLYLRRHNNRHICVSQVFSGNIFTCGSV
jgi:hypothetical protein